MWQNETRLYSVQQPPNENNSMRNLMEPPDTEPFDCVCELCSVTRTTVLLFISDVHCKHTSAYAHTKENSSREEAWDSNRLFHKRRRLRC